MKSKPTVLIYNEIPPNSCLIVEVDAFVDQLREVADLLEQNMDKFNTTTLTVGEGGLVLGKGVAETLEEIGLLYAEGPAQ